MDVKSPTTHKQQLELLRYRGCIIDDESFCLDILAKINYYRFSAYFLPFRTADKNIYKDGTQFSKVYRIYEFDRYLRRLILSAIEEIEIYVRAKLAYFIAHKYGALGYEDKRNFNDRHKHERFLRQHKVAKNIHTRPL